MCAARAASSGPHPSDAVDATGRTPSDAGGDTVADWLALVDDLFPVADAEGWDAVGLHVGDPGDPVAAVLLSLDVTPAVVDEAAERGAGLVLAHHPLLLRPLERLTPATAAGRTALHAARRGVAVAAAHTNLDVAVGGTSDPVVRLLGLEGVTPLRPTPAPPRHKLVTFVPRDDTHAVIAALGRAGAGRIGEYDGCSFRTPGIGTFRPGEGADPVIGARGRHEEVAEDRVEMVVDATAVGPVVAALREAHPYEEVAFDLLPLADAPQDGPRSGKGLGRVGDLPEPDTLRALARRIQDGLPAPHLRLAGDPDARVRRVAVCGGAGDSLIPAALAAGAQLYVTGDLRHHPVLDARTQGLALIDAGHHATESACLPDVAERLTALAARRGLTGRLLASATPTDPFAAPHRWQPAGGGR